RTELYTLSLHDALPIWGQARAGEIVGVAVGKPPRWRPLAAILGVVFTLVVGQTAYADETDTGTTTVSFNVAEAIEVTSWPTATFTLSDAGTPGVPVVSEVFSVTVKSNASWGLQVSTDSIDGSLREF